MADLYQVILVANNVGRLAKFYRDALGCKLERGPGENGLAQLRAGRSLIDLVGANGPLGQQGGDQPDHAAPNMDHVCFQVQPWDADAINGQLKRHGIEAGSVAQRYGAAGVGPSMYLRDPEGNTVELKGAPQ